ncbi:MAG: radical SAM protein [Dehalococcoidia bacterium]|nr:radical SAM protein [Dehalococcoidia bacterium]
MLGVTSLLTGAITEADPLRFGRQSATLPSQLLHYSQDKRPVVVWNTTRRCNLHCAHCYTDSADREYPGELSTAEGLAMIEGLAEAHVPVLLLSGGEPLRHPALLDFARHARHCGMRVVISTNGTLITDETAEALADIGVSYVGISVDGRPEVHDRFRGSRGAFDASMRGIEACRQAGLKVGLRVTLTRSNMDDLPWIFDLMEERDVPRLCIYHLAPTGRGARIQDFTPTHAETRAAMDYVFGRVLAMSKAGRSPEVLTADNHSDAAYLLMFVSAHAPERVEEVRQLLRWNGGNGSGHAIASIDADGTVYADQFWRWRPLGNVREQSFTEIWDDAPPPLLTELRDRHQRLPARCQGCQYLDLCNGNFRSRADAVTGDPWGMDPLCYLSDEEVGIDATN